VALSKLVSNKVLIEPGSSNEKSRETTILFSKFKESKVVKSNLEQTIKAKRGGVGLALLFL